LELAEERPMRDSRFFLLKVRTGEGGGTFFMAARGVVSVVTGISDVGPSWAMGVSVEDESWCKRMLGMGDLFLSVFIMVVSFVMPIPESRDCSGAVLASA
jgi:hypothetical protein